MFTEGKERIDRFLQPFAKAVAWVSFRPKVVGMEHIPQKGGAVIVSNHPTYLDPVLLAIFSPRPLSFLAKRRVFSMRFIRTFLWLTDCVPVEQDAPDRRALRRGLSRNCGAEMRW